MERQPRYDETPVDYQDTIKLESELATLFVMLVGKAADLPYPCTVNRTLSSDDLALDITADVYKDKEKSEAYAHDIILRIDEIEPVTSNQAFDYITITHCIYIHDDDIKYDISYMLVNEQDSTNITLGNYLPGSTKRKSKKQDVLSQIDQPLLTKEKLKSLMDLVGRVLKAQANE